MIDLAFIQWMQIADAIAWAVAFVVFLPSVIAVWRGRDTVTDFMAPPMLLIAINRIWASSAWLIFPHEMVIPNELVLRSAVHGFSVLCAAVVVLTYRRSTSRTRR